MILTLNITEDSKVELIKDGCEAVQGEHNVTILNINFPSTIKGYSIDNYAKQIEFAECKELGECVKFMDVLEGNTYKLCSTCTQFEKLMIQFTLKNLVDEAEPIVWKTVPFMLEFCESINAENNKEVQVTLLSLAEIKAEWATDLNTTKNAWEAFIKAHTLRMIYKVGDVPTPDATSLGDTIFYLGENSTEPYTLTYGHYYRCNLANGAYEWTDLTIDPNLADVANGIREINHNQTMQFWVGTKEELENEVPQPNVGYIPQVEDDDGVIRLGDMIIPQKRLLFSSNEGATSYTFTELPKKIEVVYGGLSSTKHSIILHNITANYIYEQVEQVLMRNGLTDIPNSEVKHIYIGIKTYRIIAQCGKDHILTLTRYGKDMYIVFDDMSLSDFYDYEPFEYKIYKIYEIIE